MKITIQKAISGIIFVTLLIVLIIASKEWGYFLPIDKVVYLVACASVVSGFILFLKLNFFRKNNNNENDEEQNTF